MPPPTLLRERAGVRPRAPRRQRRIYQRSLFCWCGRETPFRSGLCRGCYRRRQLSLHLFGGLRDTVLDRDQYLCRACGSARQLAVHHRVPGMNRLDLLVTVCAACHASLHRSMALRRWLPEFLVILWREFHSGVPVQLQLDLTSAVWRQAT